MRAAVGPADTVLEDEKNDCGEDARGEAGKNGGEEDAGGGEDAGYVVDGIEAFELYTFKLGKVVLVGGEDAGGEEDAVYVDWVEAFELYRFWLGKVVLVGGADGGAEFPFDAVALYFSVVIEFIAVDDVAEAGDEGICTLDAAALDVTNDAISVVVDGSVVVSIDADDETIVFGTSMHTVSCVRLHACDMYFPSLQTLQFMQSKSPSLSGPHVPTANVTPAAH